MTWQVYRRYRGEQLEVSVRLGKITLLRNKKPCLKLMLLFKANQAFDVTLKRLWIGIWLYSRCNLYLGNAQAL